MLCVRILIRPGCTTLCDKVCQGLATGAAVSSTNKTDRHNITEILLKVVWTEFELMPLVVICTDCTCSCISNYYATTMVPFIPDWYMSVKRKVNYTNGYAVINPVWLTMFMILFTSILINLIIRSFQCEFVSSEKYTIGLTIQA
jgi:hypothetical protein